MVSFTHPKVQKEKKKFLACAPPVKYYVSSIPLPISLPEESFHYMFLFQQFQHCCHAGTYLLLTLLMLLPLSLSLFFFLSWSQYCIPDILIIRVYSIAIGLDTAFCNIHSHHSPTKYDGHTNNTQ